MRAALSLETSGRAGSIALMDGGDVVAVRTFPHGLHHAATLLPLAAELLAEARVAVGEVRAVYVSIGPGSFTGLRVAVTVAKTWAMARPGVAVVAVPTLWAIAYRLPAEAMHAAPMLDAKRGQVFVARYERVGGDDEPILERWVERVGPHLGTVGEIAVGAPRPLWATGEGAAGQLATGGADGVVLADPAIVESRAEVVGRLGFAMWEAGRVSDALTLTPMYVRLPEAVEKAAISAGR